MADKHRASKNQPCPICGATDWPCYRSTAQDGYLLAGCGKATSAPAGWRYTKTDRSGCYLYVVDEAPKPGERQGDWQLPRPQGKRSNNEPRPEPIRADHTQRLAKLWEQTTDEQRAQQRAELAVELGLPAEALDAWSQRIGWDPDATHHADESVRGAWFLIELDTAGKPCGVSWRFPRASVASKEDDRAKPIGNKSSPAGGKRGLSLPDDWRDRPGPVLLLEGASDTIAASWLGLNAAGRPSNLTGSDEAAVLFRRRPVIIVGENDPKPDGRHPGREGAEATAAKLAKAWGRPVHVAYPPDEAKDLRDWLHAKLEANPEADPAQLGNELMEHVTPAGPLLLAWEPKKKGGKATVQAWALQQDSGAPTAPLHTDQVNLEAKRSRDGFAKDTAAAWNKAGLGELDPDDIAVELLKTRPIQPEQEPANDPGNPKTPLIYPTKEDDAEDSPAVDAVGLNEDAVALAGDVGQATERGLAAELLKLHGDRIAWSPSERKWYWWTGKRWVRGAGEKIKALATRCQPNLPFDPKKLVNSTLNGAIEIAKNLVRQVHPSHFDAHPTLVNLANGILNLEGHLEPHDPDRLLAHQVALSYDPEAACPNWEKALLAMMDGNRDLVEYVQRLLGYTLIGEQREHLFILCHGHGSNGKSLFFETLDRVLGPLAGKTAPRLILKRQGESHPTELADLQGIRFAYNSETNEADHLDEEKVKSLTGGDTITARRMREDFWRFVPTHTLWLSSNHKPRISGEDHGIWRRVRLLPFNVTFWDPDDGQTGPEHLRADKQLPQKLKAETTGIFAWIVQGAKAYLEHGLQAPKAVRDATDAYRRAEDHLGQFLGETYVIGDKAQDWHRIPVKDVRQAYEDWCEVEGYRPVGAKRFNERLQREGAARKSGCRDATGKSYQAWARIRTRNETDPDPQQESTSDHGGQRAGGPKSADATDSVAEVVAPETLVKAEDTSLWPPDATSATGIPGLSPHAREQNTDAGNTPSKNVTPSTESNAGSPVALVASVASGGEDPHETQGITEDDDATGFATDSVASPPDAPPAFPPSGLISESCSASEPPPINGDEHQLLGHLPAGGWPMGLADLARLSVLGKERAHRSLERLKAAGYVAGPEGGGWTLTSVGEAARSHRRPPTC